MPTETPQSEAPIIGVLALQGAYEAHAKTLFSLGATPRLIRRPDQLKDLDGLIIPGGESTTFLKHLERDGFFSVLNTFVRDTPTFGTCAGVILLGCLQGPDALPGVVARARRERMAGGPAARALDAPVRLTRGHDTAVARVDETTPGRRTAILRQRGRSNRRGQRQGQEKAQ